MSAFSEWRKRVKAREAKRAGDPWICPYCRALHPEYEIGGTPFGFGYPSVKLSCCGRVAYMYRDPKTHELLRFVRIAEGNAEWMPEAAYFAWVEASKVARGKREDSPHRFAVGQPKRAKLRPDVAPGAKGQADGDGDGDRDGDGAAGASAPLAGPQLTEFVAVAKKEELKPDTGLVVEVQGHPLALFLHNGAYFAITNRCGHAAGPLGKGGVEDGVVTCPSHGYRWNLATGCNEANPDQCVPVYPVRVEGDAVLVGPPAPRGT